MAPADLAITSSKTIVGEEVAAIYGSRSYNGRSRLYIKTNSKKVYVGFTDEAVYSENMDAEDKFYEIIKNDGTPLIGVDYIEEADCWYNSSGASTTMSKPVTWFAMEDGTYYVWGWNDFGQFGNGTKTIDEYVDSLTEVKPRLKDGTQITDIKRIIADSRNTYLLTNSGEVYGTGDNSQMQLLSSDISESLYFIKLPLSNIKDIQTADCESIALTNDGKILYWGKGEMIKDLGYTNIVSLGKPAQIPAIWPTFSGLDANGVIHYDIIGKYGKNSFYFSSIITNSEQARIYSSYAGRVSVIYDDVVYNENKEIVPKGFEGKIVDALRTYSQGIYLVSEEGSLYNDGKIVLQTSIRLDMRKVEGSVYSSEEKYNDSVTINVKENVPNSLNYKVKELEMDVGYGTSLNTDNGDAINIIAIPGVRVYKEYYFYDSIEEEKYHKSIIVDLYNREIDLTKINVSDGGILPIGQSITWEENNGLEGNNTTATLTKPDGTTITYAAGTKLSVEGAYSIHIIDDYGNETTIAFEVVDVPIPKSINFTSNATPLIYKDINTSMGGTVGELSLVYETGKTPSKIKTITISGGNDDGYFDDTLHIDPITKKVTLLAKTDILAGTYNLTFSGTDENNISFTDLPVSITVNKATNPMDWNADTKDLISNGMFYGENHTLGVEHPSEMTVTYKQTSNNSLVTVAANGTITVSGMNADTMNITVEAIPSGTTNYDLTTKTATITIRKHTLSLKTVIGTDQKDRDQITLADDLPSFDVISTTQLPNGITLPTPVGYSLYDTSGKEVSALTKHGIYEVRANYAPGALDDYKVTWGYAELEVNDVTINNGNASSYYDLILDDGINTPYTPGTWTNQKIKVIPKHKNFSLVGINGEEPTDGTKEYTTEGDHPMTLVFKNSAGARISTTVDHVMYDQTAPVMTGFTYKDATSTLSYFLRAITFNQFFAKEQIATFVATDIGGSGIDTYSYTLNKVNDNGGFLSKQASGTGTSVNLPVNANYELIVTAVDHAGNESTAYTEYIKIDDNVPELKAEATYTDTGDDYDGSWTTRGITITLNCTKDIKQYEYSVDGTTYIAMSDNTLTIPNTDNVNNVTYLFRGTTLTGMKTTASVSIKIDKELPEVDVNATSNGTDYHSGDISEHDITINVINKTNNISGTTYYYTTDSNSSSSDPTASGSNWNQVTNPITISDNGMATYYFKAVTGAGSVSPIISFDTDVRKKEYTDVNVDVKSNGLAYKSGWTKHDVTFTLRGGLADASLITGYEYCVTNGAAPASTDTWFPISAVDNVYELTVNHDMEKKTFWFRVDEDGLISDPIEVNIDHTAPIISQITYTETTRTALQTLVKSLSFDQLFKKAQTATFVGSDIGGSGVKEYEYTLSTIDDSFAIISAGSKKTGTSVNLAKNQNYKLEVIAIDEAGNTSTPYVEYIKINEKIGEFDLKAETAITKSAYTGTWTNEAIDIIMSSTEVNMEYAYSLDGINYTPLSTPEYTIDNTSNRNGEVFYFKSENAKGEVTVKQVTANIDIDTPEVTITGTSNGDAYTSGEVTNDDVILAFDNPVANISGQTYYYTKDATIAGKDPKDQTSGWIKLSTNTISLVKNETATYYVVAVSGAGLTSSVANFDVSIQKKAYTKPVIKSTTEGKLYTSGMWAKEDVIVELTGGIADTSLITSYEYTITDGTLPNTASTWTTISAPNHTAIFTINNETQKSVYWFKAEGAGLDKISNPLEVRLDLTNPVVEEIKLTYQHTDGLSKFLNMITLGTYFNQEIDVEVITSDNLSDASMMKIEIQEVKSGTAGRWQPYTGKLHYGDGTNLIIRARVKDAAGRTSDEKESPTILLDVSSPTIEGVSNGAEYYLPRYVTYEDLVSGIDPDTTTYKDGAGDHTLSTPITFRGIGKVQLHVQDMAENITELTFEIKALPVIDDLSDSDQDREIISDIVKEYEEAKEHMTEKEQKDFEEWLENAKEKTKKYVHQIKEPESNIIITGMEDTKFEEGISLIVDMVTDQFKATDLHLEKVEGLSEQSKLQEAFDIYLKKGTEIMELPEKGKVKVKIPYTLLRQAMKNMNLVCIDDKKQATVVSYKIEETDGSSYITFETDDLNKVYGLVADVKDIWNNQEVNIDSDNDGKPDINIDIDNDGIPDINIDLNHDRIPDLDIDVDGDGLPDLNIDIDHDGVADDMLHKIESWNPETDCEYNGFVYDTMGSLQDIVNQLRKDKEGQGTEGPQPDDQDGDKSGNQTVEPATKVKGMYTGTNTGGASTGDETNIIIYMGIGSCALGILTSVLYKRKRE